MQASLGQLKRVQEKVQERLDERSALREEKAFPTSALVFIKSHSNGFRLSCIYF